MAIPAPVGVVRPTHQKCFLNHLNIHNGGEYAAAVRNPTPAPKFATFLIFSHPSSLNGKILWQWEKAYKVCLGDGWGWTGSADVPACQFPDNVFCCYCQDYVCCHLHTHYSLSLPLFFCKKKTVKKKMLKYILWEIFTFFFFFRIPSHTFVITNRTPTSPNSKICLFPNLDKFPTPPNKKIPTHKRSSPAAVKSAISTALLL